MDLRHIAILMICATPLFIAQPSTGDDDRADEALAAFSAAVEQLTSILQDETAASGEKRARIESVLDRSLDMAFVTRSALGRNVERFSRDELVDFAQEIERYVIATWLQRIARAKVEEFEIVGASWDGETGTAIVRMRGGTPIVTRDPRAKRAVKSDTEVEYQLRERGGEWRLVRMVVGGVDPVRLFRDQFSSVLDRGEPAEVIRRLREANARLDGSDPFAT